MATRTRPPPKAKLLPPAEPEPLPVPVEVVVRSDRSRWEEPSMLERALQLLGTTSRYRAERILRAEFLVGRSKAARLMKRAEEVILPRRPEALEGYRANVLAQLDHVYELALAQDDVRAAVAALDRKAKLLGLDIRPEDKTHFGHGKAAGPSIIEIVGRTAGGAAALSAPLSPEEEAELEAAAAELAGSRQ